ncbi:MAG: molybdopterin cofactor-binding domain-containing protein [Burkholderiales bacterium]
MTHPAESFLASAVTAAAGASVSRRGFLTFAAKGLVVGCLLPVAGRVGHAAADAAANHNLATAYIHIGTDNSITLMFGGCEMGQGSMTGLAQLLAEELMVDWNQVTVQQALADPVVSYLTGGSSAVRGRYDRLRSAGIAAREMLVGAAMLNTNDTTRSHYVVASATVTHTPTNTTWKYGDLAVAAAGLNPPDPLPPFTDPSKFRIVGKRIPRADIPAKTDGSAVYGIDVRLPGMVYAAIRHAPVFGATLPAGTKLAAPSGALAVVPVTASDSRGAVVKGTINAVAVVATNTWLANRLARGMTIPWVQPASTASVDTTTILTQAKALAAAPGGALIAEPTPPTGVTPAAYAPTIEGQVTTALGTATIDATFTLPYLAHATMEVLNCTCSITTVNGATKCEIWAPTQASLWVSDLAKALTGATEVVVHTTFLGGGLGRKFELDFVSQSIQVAMAVGKPVKLTWFREEDFAHDQYRPLAVVNAKATLDGANRIKGWWYRNVSSSILGQRGWLPPGAVDSQAVEGSVRLPYNLGTHLSEWVPLPNSVAAIPVGFWRSVGSSINAFAVESMIDELSQKTNPALDPFQFRLSLIDPNADPRAVKVLQLADSNSQWRKSLASGHTWGMAYAESFGTRVCEVVEISTPTTTSVKVHRVLCVVDCGIAVNPDSVEAQMQGGILHGLNAALWGQSTFTAGKANQTNFSRYRVMRPSEMPTVTVVIVPSTDSPSGTGEPGVPPIAPALANAYARLTGVRKRDLPLFPGATMSD